MDLSSQLGGDVAPPGDIWQHLGMVLLVSGGHKGAIGVWGAEARDAAHVLQTGQSFRE